MKFDDGYFVGIKGHESVSDNLDNIDGDVADFISENGFHLNDIDHYLGGWVDDGKLYLDVSTHVDEKRNALQKGYENDQKAIYDIKRGLSIYLR
jgi:hypothetical protein